MNNVWAAPADGTGKAVQLTNYPDGQAGAGGFWSGDGQTFFFQRGGRTARGAGDRRRRRSRRGRRRRAAADSRSRLTARASRSSSGRAAAAVAPAAVVVAVAGAAGAVVRARLRPRRLRHRRNSGAGSDLIVHTFAGDADQKVAHVDGRIGGVSWSPDGTKLAYTTSGAHVADRRRGDRPAARRRRSWRMRAAHRRAVVDAGRRESDLHVADAGGGGGGAAAAPIQIQTHRAGNRRQADLRRDTGGGGGAAVAAAGELHRAGRRRHAEGDRGRSGRRRRRRWPRWRRHLARRHARDVRRARRTTARRARPSQSTSTAARRSCCTRRPKTSSSARSTTPPTRSRRTTSGCCSRPTRRAGIRSTSCRRPAARPCRSRRRRAITGARCGRTTARTSRGTRTRRTSRARGRSSSRRSATTRRRRRSRRSRPAAARTRRAQWSPDDKRILYQHTDAQNSADLYVADAAANAKATRADVVDAGEHRQVGAHGAAARPLSGTRRQAGAGVALRAEESRSHEEACGDRLDSSRRRESELRRLAHRSQRSRLLRVPSVPAAAGLRRHRAGLSRQHRLRTRLAQRRLHGRRRQRREGRAHGARLSQDARLRGSAIASACGA